VPADLFCLGKPKAGVRNVRRRAALCKRARKEGGSLDQGSKAKTTKTREARKGTIK
jgi:hypothetical protein